MSHASIPPYMIWLAAMAVLLWLVGHNLPAALLFVFPGLMRSRETDDDGSLDPAAVPAMERVDADLRGLGFVKLGAIEVCPPLSRCRPDVVYGAPALATFADVNGREGSINFTLFTPFQGGEAVLTSNFRRRGSNDPAFLSGGLPGIGVPEIWAAHRRRVTQMSEGPRHAVPWPDVTLAGRLAANDRFYAGVGRAELRARGAFAVTMFLTGLVLIAYIGLNLIRFF